MATASSAPYIKRSATSKQAAVDIGSARETLREKVYLFLKTNGPSTDEAIQLGLNMNPSTQRPRRIELVEQGRVKDTGGKWRTISGRAASVWEAI